MSLKIIGIYGKSGVGKSTAAKYISEQLKNAKVIAVDKIYINYLLTNQKARLIDVCGNEIFINGNLNMNLLITFPDKDKIIFDESVNDLEIMVLQEIEEASKTYDYIIVDFFRLLSLKKIWRLCQYRILIEAINDDKRYKNIVLRQGKKEQKITRTKEEELRLRDYLIPDYKKYKYDFRLVNSYNKSFEKDIDNIVKEISNSTFEKNINEVKRM